MKVLKIINNNFIVARDRETEVVAMGRGLGFDVEVGQDIDLSKVQKIFRLGEKKYLKQYSEIIENTPEEHIQIANEVIYYIKSKVKKKLNGNIYITLTDHISFAIERFRKGISLQNPLRYDVKVIYQQEYEVGKYAIKIIRKRTGLSFPDDEAASIALHIVNSEYETEIDQLVHLTEYMGDTIRYVESFFDLHIEETSLDFNRFITHLRFFLLRLLKKEHIEVGKELKDIISNNYAKEYECAANIVERVCAIYGCENQQDEAIYLALHIRRLLEHQREGTNEK